MVRLCMNGVAGRADQSRRHQATWSEWGNWTDCSKMCGIRSHHWRECIHQEPSVVRDPLTSRDAAANRLNL